MKSPESAFKLTAAFILASLLCSMASASDDVYKKMANDFSKYSANKKVKNVAVLGFARRAHTSREESEYISEKLLSSLVECGKVNLLERAQLDKVLEERRLAASGVTDEPADGGKTKINPSDAIIVGTIFGTKEHLKIIAKMIDPLTGAVLHTVEAETGREFEMLGDKPGFEFEVPDLRDVAGMFGESEMNPAFADFRDAPASANAMSAESCNSRRAHLAEMQRGVLDAKARFWAQQLRDPAFESSGLKHNPGAELSDEGDKKKFYQLLQGYNATAAAPQLSRSEMEEMVSIAQEEQKVSDECGLR
jgi:hypothetical protein